MLYYAYLMLKFNLRPSSDGPIASFFITRHSSMIRPATESDLPSIITLFQSEPGFWNPAWSEETLRKALRSAGDLGLVWEENGEILAFACAHDLGFRGYLSELIVSSRTRGQGIGRRLVEEIERELARRGCPLLIADVWKDAAGFYQSLGWSPPDVILLRKKLTAKAQRTQRRR